MTYQRQKTVNRIAYRGSYHIRASKSRPRSRSPRSSCQPHSCTLPAESLLALHPSMRGLPHLLMQMPPCQACTNPALSCPNSEPPRLWGLPIRITRRLRLPEWG